MLDKVSNLMSDASCKLILAPECSSIGAAGGESGDTIVLSSEQARSSALKPISRVQLNGTAPFARGRKSIGRCL